MMAKIENDILHVVISAGLDGHGLELEPTAVAESDYPLRDVETAGGSTPTQSGRS